jgi:hypothetical protein
MTSSQEAVIKSIPSLGHSMRDRQRACVGAPFIRMDEMRCAYFFDGKLADPPPACCQLLGG